MKDLLRVDDLTVEEMWNLAALGYMPLKLVLGTAVYALGIVGGVKAITGSAQVLNRPGLVFTPVDNEVVTGAVTVSGSSTTDTGQPVTVTAQLDNGAPFLSTTASPERGIGAARDVIQNHLLQLLALIAMEEPVAFDADSLRMEKEKVLSAHRNPREVAEYASTAALRCPAVRPHSRTILPARAHWIARAVPQEPAPSTATSEGGWALTLSSWRSLQAQRCPRRTAPRSSRAAAAAAGSRRG